MEKVWLKHYGDIPEEVTYDQYGSMIDMIEEAVEKYGDKPAFHCGFRDLSFRDVDQLSRDFAAYLQEGLGLKKGDRIAIMLPNILPFPVAMMGIQRAGLVQVNVNPLYTPRELGHQLQDADAETIVIFNMCTPTLAAVLGDTPVKNVITVETDDLLNLYLDSPPVHPALNEFSVRFTEALATGADMEYTRPKVTQDDLIFLQYTGGTTGLSKGAMLTHGNLLANMAGYDAVAGHLTVEGDETIITALPLYHIFALMVNLLTYFKYGAKNVLIPNPRDMVAFVAELKRHRMTAFSGVNTLFGGLMMHPEFPTVDFSGLKITWAGGSSTATPIAQKWAQVTGVEIREGYGLSETSPVVSINPPSFPKFTGTIGIPFPSTEISLRDDQGNEVAMGEPGELCVRGPQVMQGYWNREDATSEVFTKDGFFMTGDIATCNDGLFKIVDRKKDMIIVSGFNVYPLEIEEVAAGIKGVVETACVGVADAKTGEAVKLFIAPKVEGLTAEAVIAHCRENLTGYKVPKQVEFMDELPKSAVGKVLRRELRDA